MDRVGQQFGNYRLVQLLGQGGFADVYLGEHIYLKTRAALKILQMRLGSDALESFLQEAQTIVRLEHKHIVRVLECGVENQIPFLVMQYAPGGSLRQQYPKGSRLPAEVILSYVKQVASALQYAHDRRLIHRDIKPENILLEQSNHVLLSDFGLVAMAQSTGSSTAKEMAGTVPYMAPEQLQGKARPASDQYALAIVAYEWLSGERPFQGSFVEIASQHILAAPPSLYGRVEGVPPAVERVIFTALAKDPGQRFPTVVAFADALEQAVIAALGRPLNLSTSNTLDQSSQATFVKVLPNPSERATNVATPHNVPAPAYGFTPNIIDPLQVSQGSQPTYMIYPDSSSQQRTVLSNQQKEHSSSPAIKNSQPGFYPLSGPMTPAPVLIPQPNAASPGRPKWPIIALAGIALLVLLILLPFVLIPGLTKGTENSGPTPIATAPLSSLSPHAVKTAPASNPTRVSQGSANQAPTAIPTTPPTQVPILSPTPILTPSPTVTTGPTQTPTLTPTPSPSPTPTVLPAPVQISPVSGSVFNYYPRTTTFTWNAVPGAASYTIQVYFYPPGDTTCTGGAPDGAAQSITGTSFTFNFVGAQPGCWQVWAVDANGQQGTASPLWEFSYTV